MIKELQVVTSSHSLSVQTATLNADTNSLKTTIDLIILLTAVLYFTDILNYVQLILTKCAKWPKNFDE